MTYVKSYIQDISFKGIEYALILGALLLAVLLFLHVRKKYPIWRALAAVVLYAYVFVVLSTTVLSRPDYGYYNYELELFWSWRDVIENQNRWLAIENFFNMILLTPAGFLFPLAVSDARFKHVFFFGLLCTGTIEVLQLVLQRGLFEWDDIVHNMIGVCVGYGMYWIIRCIYLLVKSHA